MSEVRPKWPRRDVLLADRTLSVRENSSLGEPALLIHGLGGNATNWTDLMGELDDVLAGTAVDLPGFGSSPPPRDGDLTPSGHAMAVAALIDAEIAAPVHVFGNSLGGAVAVELLRLRPDLVRTVTLVSPAMPEYLPRRATIQLPLISLPGLGSRAVSKYLELPAERRVAASIEVCFADPSIVPAQRWREEQEAALEWGRLPYAGDVLRRSTQGMLAGFLRRKAHPWRTLAQSPVPLLCVYGREDRLVRPAAAFKVSRARPGATVVVLPGVGHVAQLESPGAVAAIWRDWRLRLAD